jgi:hypothetical protein
MALREAHRRRIRLMAALHRLRRRPKELNGDAADPAILPASWRWGWLCSSFDLAFICQSAKSVRQFVTTASIARELAPDLQDGPPVFIKGFDYRLIDHVYFSRLMRSCIHFKQPPVRRRGPPTIGPYSVVGSVVSGCNFLKADAQFSLNNLHLLTHLSSVIPGMCWLRQIAPRFFQPFLQRLYILIESVRHGPTSKIQR